MVYGIDMRHNVAGSTSCIVAEVMVSEDREPPLAGEPTTDMVAAFTFNLLDQMNYDASECTVDSVLGPSGHSVGGSGSGTVMSVDFRTRWRVSARRPPAAPRAPWRSG